jgi:hypothetical protein
VVAANGVSAALKNLQKMAGKDGAKWDRIFNRKLGGELCQLDNVANHFAEMEKSIQLSLYYSILLISLTQDFLSSL